VEQIVAAGVRRVVAAARDPNPRIDGRGLAALRRQQVEIEPEDPSFARRAAALNEVFFHSARTGRPFVTLKAGMTLDGRIALAGGASQWITSEEARRQARALRERSDAVLVGIGTALADDPLLLPAPSGSPHKAPLRVVLDSRLRLPADSRLAASVADGAVLVYAAEGVDEGRRGALERVRVVVVPCRGERPGIEAVLDDLAARGIRSVLVEGGAETHASLLAARRVDKVVLFVEPALMGGVRSVPVVGGTSPGSLAAMARLERWEARRAGSTLVISGYPAAAERAE
jgi:diaminohydroxyphosphoribosylaminopyrimidine deaminase/5-amino-6-(5-phosphoribosylamino)uracil reductase